MAKSIENTKSFWPVAALLLAGSILGASHVLWGTVTNFYCAIASQQCGTFKGSVSDSPFAEDADNDAFIRFLSDWNQRDVTLDVHLAFASNGVQQCPRPTEQLPDDFCLGATSIQIRGGAAEFLNAQSHVGETYRLLGRFGVNERFSNATGHMITLTEK